MARSRSISAGGGEVCTCRDAASACGTCLAYGPRKAKNRALVAPGATKSIGVASDPEVVFTQPERAFEREVIRYAETMGWLIHKDRATNAPRTCPCCQKPLRIPRNDPGFPDLVMVRSGRVVWVELKSERGKLTKDQLCWLRALWAAGEDVFVWRPSDWETIAKELR